MAERITDRLTVVDGNGREVLQFDAGFAALDLGAEGNEGDLRIRGNDGAFKFHFDGGRMLFYVRDAEGRDVLQFHAPNGQLRVGSQGNAGDVFVFDSGGATSIHLNGNAGDIILQNADCAEEFDCAGEVPEPGTVVVLDPGGGVVPSSRPYDTRVAGIVSGAGDYKAALVLDRQSGGAHPRVPVAMLGKVFCRVDATGRPVRAGDLLTTSATVGHAMAVAEPARATGAMVGKALRPLPSGTGLLPVLVCLR
jgi:hypothetical protein